MSSTSISFTPKIFRCTTNNNSGNLDIKPKQPDSKLIINSFTQNETNGYIKPEKTYGLIRPL